MITVLSLLLILLNSCENEEIDFQLAPETLNKQELLDLVNKVRTNGCYCGNKYYPPVDGLV